MIPWLPAESWPGREQSDPRLDQPVNFWGAGVPLKRVFDGLGEQTGVEIGFYPPGDMNERVCVNLYLNPEDPPTLRELLVQLSWVTDCAFACSPQEPRRYWLLSTSAGHGALVRAMEWADQQSNEQGHRVREIAGEMLQEAEARLADLREALAVPEEDLVDTYLGVDDLLLLATLDPARRAFSEFLLTLPGEDLQEVQPYQPLIRPWSDWAPAQQALLREAVQLRWQREVGFDYSSLGLPGEMYNWERLEPRLGDVWVHFTGSGSFACLVMVPDPGGGAMGIQVPSIQLVVDPRADNSEEASVYSEIELRRALGEEVSEEEVERISMDLWEERQRRRVQEQVAAQLRRQHPLRRENEDLLTSLRLPPQPIRPYALWQLQELVAARSGLHIVSDCFWQPERSLDLALAKLCPEGEPPLTALAVLRAATLPTDVEIGPGNFDLSDGGVSWEWGDAGDFLRFRDYHRDICRDIFLPQEAVATFDAWIDVALPDELAQGEDPPVEVSLDPREVGMVLLPLRPEQRGYGWYLIYGDPTDTRNAYRHAFRAQLREAIQEAHPYVLFARFSESQWEELQTEGLTWGVDVLIEPDAHEVGPWFGSWSPYRQGDGFRLEDVDEEQGRRWGGQLGVTSWQRLSVYREGRDPPGDPAWDHMLPLGIVVKPKSVARLTEVEESVAVPAWVDHAAMKELGLPPYPGARPELIDSWIQEREGERVVTQVVLVTPDGVAAVQEFYFARRPRARRFPSRLEHAGDYGVDIVYGPPGEKRVLHLYRHGGKEETKLSAHWLKDCDMAAPEWGE
jgi:hypothetical protein